MVNNSNQQNPWGLVTFGPAQIGDLPDLPHSLGHCLEQQRLLPLTQAKQN